MPSTRSRKWNYSRIPTQRKNPVTEEYKMKIKKIASGVKTTLLRGKLGK